MSDRTHADAVVAGQTLRLLPERAIYWEDRRTLIAADVHLGKAATFRARGVPVPTGTTQENLGLLSALLHRWQPDTVVFLGDLVHGRSALTERALAPVKAWRAQHARTSMVLVEGNHDRSAGGLPDALQIETVGEPYELEPFSLVHHPSMSAKGYRLGGHLHPAFRIASRMDGLTLPCFWFSENAAVLPAFGAFTGSMVIRPSKGDRIFVAAADRVYALPQVR